MKKILFIFVAGVIFLNSGCSIVQKYTSGTNQNSNANRGETAERKEQEPLSPPNNKSNAASQPSTQESPSGAANASEPDLLSFGAGMTFAQKPSEYSPGFVGMGSAPALIDENSKIGWFSANGTVANQTIVLELPEKTLLKELSFDSGETPEGTAAKDIVVEMSDSSAASGFQPILTATLKNQADNQHFPVQAEVAGRWLRLTIKNNYGSSDNVELYEIRGFGEQQTRTSLENASGTYHNISDYSTMNFDDYRIKQEGTSIVGCFNDSTGNRGTFEGGLDGRVAQFNWKSNVGGDNDSGSGVMIFSPDGKKMSSFLKSENTNETGLITAWAAEKKSDAIGDCENFKTSVKGSGAAGEQIAEDLKEKGRAVVYGINFDFNCDQLRPESKPTLNQIVALLKQNGDWKMTIEGHMDNVGGADFNQNLSERRAAAVKKYLMDAGIQEARLNSVGYGLSKPISPNDSEFGRAKNRRVELVKQ